MDKLVLGRRPIRSQLTRLAKEVGDALLAKDPDLKALNVTYDLLEKNSEELANWDHKVREQLIEDAVKEEEEKKEYKEIEDFRRLYLSTKADLDKLLRSGKPVLTVDAASVSSEGKRRKFHLPEVKLRTFGGNLKDWLGWWSQFSKIHHDEDLHDSDKFQYLAQAMQVGTEAKELIDSYPQTAGNYNKAVEALRERFGRQDLLLQVYVRELLTLVITNVTNNQKLPLNQLYTQLESHLRSLTELNLNQADPATWLFPLVESSLGEDTLRAWQRSSHSKTNGALQTPPKSRLDLLMDFIKSEVQCEQQISLAQQGFQQRSAQAAGLKRNRNKITSSRLQDEIPTAAGLVNLNSSGCAFCGKPHATLKCFKAQKMTCKDKIRIIKEKGLCFKCLLPGHQKRDCKSSVKCTLCDGSHYAIICYHNEGQQRKRHHDDSGHDSRGTKNLKISSEVVHQSSNQCSKAVQMNTIKVQVKDRSGELITVRLVGDNGSQRSYATLRVIQNCECDKVGVEWLQNVLFGGTVTMPRQFSRHAVTVYGFNGKQMNLELLGKEEITGVIREIPYGPWIEKFQQQGITFNDTGDKSSTADILIGGDYWGAIRTGRMTKLDDRLVAEEDAEEIQVDL